MKYNPAIHHRRSIRLKGYDYSQTGMYFVTICAQKHQCLFGKITDGEMVLNECGKIVNDEWQYLKIKYPHVVLHEYVIMPNHFHGIVEISGNVPVGAGSARPENADDIGADDTGAGEPRPYVPTFGNIIGYFKYQTTKKNDLPVELWQRNYHEHIIRNNKSYQYISNYIINNAINWQKDKFYLD
jgi:REP element-mobilizing transposase RayT